ncbi:MAG: alpha/beta hydrolase [Planctomycetia bacterium]|nr:alpha/beta hydrolase [Planctomycetia bacterium]
MVGIVTMVRRLIRGPNRALRIPGLILVLILVFGYRNVGGSWDVAEASEEAVRTTTTSPETSSPEVPTLTPPFPPSLSSSPEKTLFTVQRDIPYYAEDQITDAYQRSQCRLDLWIPGTSGTGETGDGADTGEAEVAGNGNTGETGITSPVANKPFATIVWYHGGGLTGGRKYLPDALRTVALEREGMAIATIGYRLSPQAELPAFIEDAAAAAAWVKRHIGAYGGDPDRVFLCGGSAGGYLAAMIGTDPRWLEPYDLKPRDFAGLIPVSAQVTTHFHVKVLREIPGDSFRPVIDEYAPLAHLSVDLPPILLILGDRRIEWKARVEENEFMSASLRAMGHPDVTFREFTGFDHGISSLDKDCEPLVVEALVEFVRGH